MNIQSIILLLIILAAFIGCVVHLWRRRKQRGRGSSCDGCCLRGMCSRQ